MNPPWWAEAVLRVMLKIRDRDTITGDLLEEYREDILPARGAFRARLWYLRQALSLMSAPGLWRAGGEMAPMAWAAAAAAIEFTFVVVVPGSFGLPLGVSLFGLFAAVVAISAVSAIRKTDDIRLLWSASCLWGTVFSVVILATILGGVFAPRKTVVLIFIILMTAGFHGAWRTGQVRAGMFTAIAASVAGSMVTVAGVALGFAYGIQGLNHPPMGGGFVLLAFAVSTVLGTIGALPGKWLRKGGSECLQALSHSL